MNSAALITMLLAQGIVISVAAYFFYRVLTMPPKPDPDSNSDNDEVLIRQKY
ncbi:ICE2 family protein [Arenibacter sp. F26102]|uniref:ICE2 family protein n=1 Tax=Arenibacter sp. F26102 TaxID=2926416 RepID=UPI001FF2851E|nr:ICE2 family protein [Arenibacter sp. F26102]MCK0147312.1 ICE2 family protein [Arenibacter sp. F26102]